MGEKLKAPAENAPMIEWAIYYAKIGIPVFPIKPRTKNEYYEDKEHLGKPTPKYPNGNPYSWDAQATTDISQVKKAFQKHPNANIGGTTGQGFYVLDIDEREDGSGFNSITKWEASGILPGKVNLNTWTSITGSGGKQLFYYLVPELVEIARTHNLNYAGDAAMIDINSHVDTRGDGRYVVLPPSTHPNGNKYTWEKDKRPDNIEIANFDRTIEYIFTHKSDKRKNRKTSTRQTLASGEKIPKGARRTYMLSKVGELVHKLVDVADDSAIVAAAMQIAQNDLDTTEPLDSGWDGLERDIEKMVFDFRSAIMKSRADGNRIDWSYNVRAWHLEHPNQELTKPINWAEVQAAGERLRAKEAAPQGASNKAAPESNKAVSANTEIDPEKLPNLGAFVITTGTLIKKELPPTKYIIDGLLPEGFGLLAAPPKSYKSFLCLQMCVEVCRGAKILGHDTTKTKCLYFDLESGNRRPRQRLIDMGMVSDKSIENNLMFITKEELKLYQDNRGIKAPLTLANGFAEVLEGYLITNPDVGLIIVDVFGKIRSQQKKNQQLYEHDYEDIDKLQSIAARRNVCILAVHHTTKGKDDNNPFNNMGGSSGLFGAADFAWIIDKPKFSDKEATLYTAGRDIEQNELVIKWDDEKLNWTYEGTTEEVQENREQEEYEQNAIANTIKHLVETFDGSWRGTSTDIVRASKYCGHEIYEPVQKVGKEVTRLAPLLLKNDGIEVTRELGTTTKKERQIVCKKIFT